MYVTTPSGFLCILTALTCLHCRQDNTTRNCTLFLAVSANMKPVMTEWTREYAAQGSLCSFQMVFGSSGRLYTQLQQGLKADIFFSADMEYPSRLVDAGLAEGPVISYAVGRSVLFIRTPQDKPTDPVEYLSKGSVKLAIPDPEMAPYGRVAIEWLKENKLLGSVSLIRAPNAQAAFLFASTSTNAGIVPLSVQKMAESNPSLSGKHWVSLPDASPVVQGAVILKRATDRVATKVFLDWTNSPFARRTLLDGGYDAPPDW